MHRRAQLLHPGKAAAGLNIVRQIDNLLQQGHVRLAGGVVENGVINFVRNAEAVPGYRRAGLGMEQLEIVPLHLVQRDGVVSAQGQLLGKIQLLGAVVEQGRDPGRRHIRAVFFRQEGRLLLRAQHMGHTLGL